MASSLLAEDLTCSVCLSIFTDPVTLQCGHSFCRRCAGEALAVQPRCPQCCLAVATEAHALPSSFILKSLAEKARAARSLQEVDLCPEHEEKLKLFCLTDQQLTCIICRDAERHEGHTFKPVKEADALLRKELERFLQNASRDISAVEDLADKQRVEITKSQNKSEHLMTQISNQFKEMHEFLTRREKQIKNELRQKEEDELKRMGESLSTIKTVLSESKGLEAKANSALKMTDPERFLKSWTEDNNRKTTEDVFRPRAKGLRVENTSFSLGPYESHLQFFVWKEMLEIIHPREERLSLSDNSQLTVVSNSGRSLFWESATARSQSAQMNSMFGTAHSTKRRPKFQTATQNPGGFSFGFLTPTGHAVSSSEFTSGQHYWEVDVGRRGCWKLGINDHYLDYDGQRYAVCGPNTTREVTVAPRLQKIGFYLNCSSMQLSFYDAGSMTLIDTVDWKKDSLPVSACLQIQRSDPDYEPLTVCWY